MVEIFVRKNKSNLCVYLLLNILVTSFSCLLGVDNSSNLSLKGVPPELSGLFTDDEAKQNERNLQKLREEKVKKAKELVQSKENLYQLQQENKVREKKRIEEEKKKRRGSQKRKREEENKGSKEETKTRKGEKNQRGKKKAKRRRGEKSQR